MASSAPTEGIRGVRGDVVGAINDRQAVTLAFASVDHRQRRKAGAGTYEVTLLGNKHSFRDAANALWKDVMLRKVGEPLGAHLWWFEPKFAMMPGEDDAYGYGADKDVPLLSANLKARSAFGDQLPEFPESIDCPLRDGVEMTFSYDVGSPTSFAVDIYLHSIPEDADLAAYPIVVTKTESNKRKASSSSGAGNAAGRPVPRLVPDADAKGTADHLFPNLSEAVMSGRFDAFFIGSQCAGMHGIVQGPDGDVLFSPVQFCYSTDWMLAFEAAWPLWKKADAAGTPAKMHLFPTFGNGHQESAGRWYDNECKAYDKIASQVTQHRENPSKRGKGPQFLMHEMSQDEYAASKKSSKAFYEAYPQLQDMLGLQQKGKYRYLVIRDGKVVFVRSGAMQDKNGQRLPAGHVTVQESIVQCRSLHDIFVVVEKALKRRWEML